jgi:hypothetical protein
MADLTVHRTCGVVWFPSACRATPQIPLASPTLRYLRRRDGPAEPSIEHSKRHGSYPVYTGSCIVCPIRTGIQLSTKLNTKSARMIRASGWREQQCIPSPTRKHSIYLFILPEWCCTRICTRIVKTKAAAGPLPDFGSQGTCPVTRA